MLPVYVQASNGNRFVVSDNAGRFPDEGSLDAVTGYASLAGGVGGVLFPPAQSEQNTLDLIGVRSFEILALLAEALAPDLHDAYTLPAHRSYLATTSKLAFPEEAAPLIQIHIVPICGKQLFQVVIDDALAIIGVHCCLLLYIGHGRDFVRYRQRFSFAVHRECFGPDLVYGGLIQTEHGQFTVSTNRHRPEPAIASDVTEKTAFRVGRTDDDVVAGMAFNGRAVGLTEFIVCPGDE